MSVTNAGSTDAIVAALDTRVNLLDEEISDLSTRLGTLDTSLNTKMDRMATTLSAELKSLSTALADKNKTPWAVLISGTAVVLTVVTLLGRQALEPIDHRITVLEDSDRSTKIHARDRLEKELDELRQQNSLLRRGKSD